MSRNRQWLKITDDTAAAVVALTLTLTYTDTFGNARTRRLQATPITPTGNSGDCSSRGGGNLAALDAMVFEHMSEKQRFCATWFQVLLANGASD